MDASLATRLKTAGFLAVPLLVLLLLGLVSSIGQILLTALALVVVLGCAYEYARICQKDSHSGTRLSYLLICLLGPLLALSVIWWRPVDCNFVRSQVLLLGFFISCLAAGAYAFLGDRSNPDHSQTCVKELPIGLLLISFGGTALVLAVSAPGGVALVFWLLLVVIANDVGAYFGGRKFAGEKLSPFVSPNKTVSGSCSGLLAGALIGALFIFLLPQREVLFTVFFALALGVSAQLGDLSKSYIKRLHSAKDMGTLLPGHGGLLDRVDGVLAAAPWLIMLLNGAS